MLHESSFDSIWVKDNLQDIDDSSSTVSSASLICNFLGLPSDVDGDVFREPIAEADDYSYGSDILVSADNIESATSLYKVTTGPPPMQGKTLMKTVCMVIVNNCIDQFTVLTSAYKPIAGEVGRRDIIYRPLVERYEFDKPVNYEEFVINSMYTNFHKMLKDVKTLIVVLKEVREEIDFFGYVSSLDTYIEDENRMQRDEEECFEEVEKKKRYFNELNRKWRNLKTENVKENQKIKKITCELLAAVKDDMECTRAKLSFVKKWEAARKEQNLMVLERQEGHFWRIIKEMEKAKNLDDIVHQNIEKFLAEEKQDIYKEIEKWMNNYDRQFEEKDMDIYRMRHRTDVLALEREGLEREYGRRIREMEEWMEYKREKREIEERIALENWAVVKIQAWWRGTMVRKKLGPYKTKKRKGKAGKGKGKKKVKKTKRSK